MQVNRSITATIVLALLTVWVAITWLEGRISGPPSAQARLAFACNGENAETRFIAEQAFSRVEHGGRHFSAANGFVVYRVEVGQATLESVSACVSRSGFYLELSPDGRSWSLLVSVGTWKRPDPNSFKLLNIPVVPDPTELSGYAPEPFGAEDSF